MLFGVNNKYKSVMLLNINSSYYQTQRKLINKFISTCFELTRSALGTVIVCKLVRNRNAGIGQQVMNLFIFLGGGGGVFATAPQLARAFSVTRFLDHTQRRTTIGRIPLDE
jgi:hypothetical protein